jgi:thiamine pyrophosphokinase
MTEPAFTILLGGTLAVTDRVREAVAGTRVIAADSGMRHARELGVEPELWVGDFDSAAPALLAEWPQVERQPYPSRKAATDGEIAVSEALERGARRVVLLGALGGERSDHALQHFAQALQLKEAGIDVLLSSGEEEAFPLLPGRTELLLPVGALFSIVGFTALTGLGIEGARYPLSGFTLPFGSSRTISNVALGPVLLTLETGRGLLLARPYDMTGA